MPIQMDRTEDGQGSQMSSEWIKSPLDEAHQALADKALAAYWQEWQAYGSSRPHVLRQRLAELKRLGVDPNYTK